MEPRRDRSETEHELVGANPYRGTPPWQREGSGGWKRGLAGLGAVLLTAGSIGAVAWLAFRDGGEDTPERGEVIAERCTVTEADDAGTAVEPLEAGTPLDRSIASIATNYGEIAVMLWGDLAPCGVEAFTYLAQAGFYTSHECDRLTTQAIDPTAILRCGSPGFEPESDDTYGPGWRFQTETGMAGNDVADVLALVTDEQGRAGSAFVLVRGAAVPTVGVSVIGGIVDGYEVLDQIAALTETVEYDGEPPVPVEIWGITVTDLNDLPTGPDTAAGTAATEGTSPSPGATATDTPTTPAGTPTGTATPAETATAGG
ncbi:peptidylprolyl isomerase [Glycomyces sp. TRM65418]|uniref:peptidylprolyl isomerase n=1 Tax=Glycomyces sp. TRM65418 TaxID=2867006 RepID=UPI001CE4FA62|nr:peptidylprolyl isomerase [Glycomyces sp. TRM65418]MCC3764110.1 peptidylprolyl isomerase [Glycomyces sp. TRM65418]QZD53798.1 peptidylprolyl isomerase [Glycomyces sp. TRM65418]